MLDSVHLRCVVLLCVGGFSAFVFRGERETSSEVGVGLTVGALGRPSSHLLAHAEGILGVGVHDARVEGRVRVGSEEEEEEEEEEQQDYATCFRMEAKRMALGPEGQWRQHCVFYPHTELVPPAGGTRPGEHILKCLDKVLARH